MGITGGSQFPVLLKLKPKGSSPVLGEPALPSSLSGLPGSRSQSRGAGGQGEGPDPLHSWLTLTASPPPTAVSEYFGGSCVPGAGETSYSKSLCRLCRGNAAGEGVCDKSPLERYYDYSGAFR